MASSALGTRVKCAWIAGTLLGAARIGLEGFIQRVFARVFNLFSSGRRIYRLSAFGFGVDVGGGCLCGPEAPVGRHRRISHQGQKEIERRHIWIGRCSGEGYVYECRLFVRRSRLATATPFTWFASSRHSFYFFYYFVHGSDVGFIRLRGDD